MTTTNFKCMVYVSLLCSFLFMACHSNEPKSTALPTLKDAFKDQFYIGVAVNAKQAARIKANEVELIGRQFNSLVAENSMKHEVIHPKQNTYDFREADEFVRLAESKRMFVVGHCLVWHSQTAPWMFQDSAGKVVSRDTLIARMKDHIFTVVGRYKGRVHGWDVVNEALNEDEGLRKSPWTEIIGDDFLELAFKFAHQADPDAELYYNDYNMYKPSKRAAAINLVKALKAAGCRVDGIGMQAHYGLSDPSLKEVENSIVAFNAIGCKVMITELDVSVLPFPKGVLTADITAKFQGSPEYNPYTTGLPVQVQEALSKRYSDLFSVFMKHSDKISRVTFWGLNNACSWRNNWPIKGRTDYPLLFDRGNHMVPAGRAIIQMVQD